MRILFTGGGTGGHFFPILALIRELKRLSEERRILDLELFYIGPDDFGEEYLKEEGVISVLVSSGKLRRYFSLKNFTDIFKLIWGTAEALWNVFLIMPDVIFSKGGYGALPVVLAAIVFRIPLLAHESDAVPGKVTTLSRRFAKRIAVAFESAAAFLPQDKTALVGVPIRKGILGGAREEARENLGIFSVLPVVGFIGASQGSQKINETALEILKELTEEFEVLHQTGSLNYEEIRSLAGVILERAHAERYHPFGFMKEAQIRDFYAACDLVVSRAGASSIYEIAAWAKPAILLPLANSAQDHQRKNAYEYAASGAALVIEETNLTPHILLSEIKNLMGDKERLKKMSLNAQRFSRIDSAAILAEELLKLGLHE